MAGEGGDGAEAGRHHARTNPSVPVQRAGPPPVPPVVKRVAGRFPSGFSSVRDVLSFLAGVAIIGNEVFLSDRVEIAFLTVGVTLAGLPIVFGADERKAPPPP